MPDARSFISGFSPSTQVYSIFVAGFYETLDTGTLGCAPECPHQVWTSTVWSEEARRKKTLPVPSVSAHTVRGLRAKERRHPWPWHAGSSHRWTIASTRPDADGVDPLRRGLGDIGR